MGTGTSRTVGGIVDTVTVGVEVGKIEAAVDSDHGHPVRKSIPAVTEDVRNNVIRRIETLVGLGGHRSQHRGRRHLRGRRGGRRGRRVGRARSETGPLGEERAAHIPEKRPYSRSSPALARRISQLTLETDGVAAISKGRSTEVATAWLGDKVVGVAVGQASVEVHVVAHYPSGHLAYRPTSSRWSVEGGLMWWWMT